MATSSIANGNIPVSQTASSSASVPFVTCDERTFRENFNQLPFEVAHRFNGHPLFELPRLVELANEIKSRNDPHRPSGDAYCLIGTPSHSDKALDAAKPVREISETIEHIEKANGWIVLHHVERNPGYQKILEDSIAEILQLTGRQVKNKIKWFESILFITSPHRSTHYHVDRECSWLLQIRGDKEIHLFPRGNKQAVPDEELERFWAVDNQAGVYKPELESQSMVYNMKPGTGVHIPVNTGHWLKNGGDVSISMNINFVFHDRLWGNIYKANHMLRQRGLKPTAPGQNAFKDVVKGAAWSAMQRVNGAIKKRPYQPEIAKEQNARIFRQMEGRW